ncbi:WD40 repeat-like protein [Panus rudis PR-1116 ss-1]|nr:WD40 repeat-like protein [Panus rudis PR-1116 ss-1]
MRFTKPSWVVHNDPSSRDQTKRLSIFSCHVHPDGSRIATGGLDAKVRIWSTKPILNANSEMSGRPPKSLCTLTMHTGPVLTVRWAHSGRWLASGSDDAIVMIWDLDPTARGKVWGSDEVNVEGWKPLKRLPGHESDVTDVAWSPGDRYLASVGLDSMVFIWCGFTLERLAKLELHQGFVKGVCWDPVGEFLATGSDDRSVKIWRTKDWSLEAEIKKPFEESPGTFFRRLSWSPDGAHITASNATNNGGYVFIAAVISRGSWTSDISLVGHENTVEVAAYNPHIFLRDPSAPVVASNICSVVALGADDRSVSVWQTKSARPLVVAKEVFERQIMDLSWSLDGYTLYAVSSDGTMAVFSFDHDELEGLAPLSVQEQYLKKFGFTPPPLPSGFSHTNQPGSQEQHDQRMTPPPSPKPAQARALSQDPSAFSNGHTGSGEVINKLVAKRKTQKKRGPSTFIGPFSGEIPSARTTDVPKAGISGSITNGRSFHEVTGIASSSRQQQQLSPLPMSHIPSTTSFSNDFGSNNPDFSADISFPPDEDVDMNTNVSIASLDAGGGKGKRKASMMDFEDRPVKPRTLGGDRVRETVAVRELAVGKTANMLVVPESLAANSIESSVAGRLPILPLLNYVKVNVEGSEDIFEGRNYDDGVTPTEVIYVNGKQTQWLDYLPVPVMALTATSTFCAATMQDGSLNVYSPTGRKIMPPISLGVPVSVISGSKNMLMVVTSTGQMHVWDVKKQQALFSPISVFPILGTSPNTSVLSAVIRPNGAPLIQLSSGVAHTYDPALLAWTKLSEGWWAEGSDAWQGRQRSSNLSSLANRGIISTIESSISERIPTIDAVKERPTWWSDAMTLGHLESRMHAAKALDSPQEYKQALLLYAKKIADQAYRAKAEELIKELFGPVYWRPGRDDSWSSTVVGMSRRDLLRDVLSIFARSKTLIKLAADWQDMLKKAANDS